MNLLYDRTKDKGQAMDKSPYNRRAESDTKKAFKSVTKSVKPVVKDTNKTKRKIEKPTKVGTKAYHPGNPMPKGGKKIKPKSY